MKPLILIVEDDLDLREVLTLALEGEGLTVLQAGDGIEALEKLSQEQVDVVLSDIKMPRMNGFDLLMSIQSQFVISPQVFLMTGHSIYSREDIIKAGAQGYFEKPINVPLLLQTLRHV